MPVMEAALSGLRFQSILWEKRGRFSLGHERYHGKWFLIILNIKDFHHFNIESCAHIIVLLQMEKSAPMMMDYVYRMLYMIAHYKLGFVNFFHLSFFFILRAYY
jgi:hypothetical protein